MDHQTVKDWHSDELDRSKRVDEKFRITQNVRRFIAQQVGEFTLGPKLRAELDAQDFETLGQVADFIGHKNIS